MGFYLEIDNKETNSKHLSRILSDTIKKLNTEIRSNENLTDEQKEVFIPEENCYNDGLTDWTITKKGIALLAYSLRDLSYNYEELRQRAMKEREYMINNCYKDDDEKLQGMLNLWMEDENRSVEWCGNYVQYLGGYGFR